MTPPRPRRYDAIPTIPIDALLDLGPAGEHVDRRARGTETGRAATSVAWGRCPMHRDPKPVGLVLDGPHLSWREHVYRTWTGAPFTCGASLQKLCLAPALDVPGTTTPHCTCLEV